MKNFFIDGMPACGKSTLITSVLDEYGLFSRCVGFRTVRVFDSKGKLYGFSHYEAFKKMEVNVVADIPEDVPHVFLLPYKEFRPGVFTDFTIKTLFEESCDGNPAALLVMDEIGGMELEIPEVFGAFETAIKSERPCIGVIKSREHAKEFAPDAWSCFRKVLEDDVDTEIVSMSAENREDVRMKLKVFLEEQGLNRR